MLILNPIPGVAEKMSCKKWSLFLGRFELRTAVSIRASAGTWILLAFSTKKSPQIAILLAFTTKISPQITSRERVTVLFTTQTISPVYFKGKVECLEALL
jgi:hypothetical protein